MDNRRKTPIVLAVLMMAFWPIARASAQEPGDEQAQPEPEGPPAEAAPDEPAVDVAPQEPGEAQAVPTVPGAPLPPPPVPPAPPRTKPLQTTLGMLPEAADFGAEADLISTADELTAGPPPKKWNYALRGFFRAPLRVGIGPRNDGTAGDELHSPPRIVGANTGEWSYVGLGPDPTVSLYLTAENRNVKGALILAASTFHDAGYAHLDQMGGVSQAYLTLRAPELFENRGGLAWTVGAFSNRYGTAGPRQNSSGYYGTYLFGRTHVAGEALTADLDITHDLELVVEHGLGAKVEVVPFIPLSSNPPIAPYLPDQGPVPQGSNFVHHAHAALLVKDWLRVAAHYMTSWSPNDRATPTGEPAKEARMTIAGAEAHLDDSTLGSAYLGYSHIDAENLLPLADGIQVLHGGNGFGFAQNYFGPSTVPDPRGTGFLPVDEGTVDTIMGQYLLRLAPLLGQNTEGPDVVVALYGMYNHVSSLILKSVDKLKVGAELQVAPLRFLTAGVRFDRVMPDGGNDRVAYSALSPRVVLHSTFLSKEYVILSYTRYFLGAEAFPSAPYNDLTQADPHMLMLSALVSF